MRNNMIKNYSLFLNYKIDLINSIILDIFVADCEVGFEGGLTIIFETGFAKGIVIVGYTELGEWIEYYQIGNEIIKDFDGYYYEDNYGKDRIDFVKKLVYEYDIGGFHDE